MQFICPSAPLRLLKHIASGKVITTLRIKLSKYRMKNACLEKAGENENVEVREKELDVIEASIKST
jgi:hypothetical protein